MFQHTIAAISTALQDGAISIIRLSGDEAISIVQSIFSKKNPKIFLLFFFCQNRPLCVIFISLLS